ncbi:ribosome small subunit-dependent GTPase A [Agrilutibacter solisilvae]|uniref:Small ribosomal subunit biogenesis GTPase RsgA n=1 Tax=Agrilutibacter solisilvae TaxID=2763317 RepID=A0A975AT58_9GAMM|nr:ribosome small subunit-dependent GTPase A [Lysobacter solisilvae]QSX78953.1 ribosome small subunit-dependent GTPase A [Lysobacter solisilvae]
MTTPDALQAIGWPLAQDGLPSDPVWREALALRPKARPARIVEQHRTGYIVADGPEHSFPVESLPEWQRPANYRKGGTAPEDRPAVGDWVLIEGDTPKHSKIVELLPRRTSIKRAAAGEHYRQQLIAANIDTVFVVCGMDADFNPRRIERYLLLVRGGAEPVVVLTKSDLAGGGSASAVDDALAALVELAAQEVPVRAVNAKDSASVAALNEWLQPGRTAVLVGSSGAGKSTLTNTLLGTEKMKTSEVRESDSRGRHTTTYRALIPLPTGACLIDTPGMRELKPTGEEDVAENFTDVETLAEQCRFRDCAHQREPGCAVRAAIESGRLDPQRFANFLKLSGEVAAAADKAAGRRAQKADEKAKVPGKAPAKRPAEKHGRR